MKLAGPDDIDPEEVRGDYESWTLANGLRDCAEALNTFLDSARRVCALYSFGPKAKISGKEWNRAILEDAQEFHQFGLAKKLEWLTDTYHPGLKPAVSGELLTVSKARNCLVHRHGIVQQVDKNCDEGLCVQWTKLELRIEGPEGRRTLELPDDLKAGEGLYVAQNKNQKAFAIGERVQFDSQEFGELCWTFFVFGRQLVAAVEEYGRSKGIEFVEREPKQA